MRKNRNRSLIQVAATGGIVFALAGCALFPTTNVALTSCEDLLPGNLGKDIFGDTEMIHVTEISDDPAHPLVSKMVTDGLACGLDQDAVFIGQLAMDEAEWTAVRDEFVADGAQQVDAEGHIPSFVMFPVSDDGEPVDAGFAWENGVLYFAATVFLFMLLPVLTD